MIAADSSTLVAWLQGVEGADVARLDEALDAGELILPPPVVSELLSLPKASVALEAILEKIERLPVTDGFWDRVGQNRRLLLAKGLKARLADALTAQVCIDADTALITRDVDYRHFAEHCGLQLAI
jgi:predicted nucleic acid-binding protein